MGWPRRHVVKCLVNYHPADPIELRLAQEARLAELRRRDHALERELLIEVICSGPGRAVDAGTLPAVMRRLYTSACGPTGGSSSRSRRSVAARSPTVDRRAATRYCHGVAAARPRRQRGTGAQRSFEVAARHPVCRGFAIGRTIFGAPARDWFAGNIDDATAVARVGAGYARMIDRGAAAARRLAGAA